MAKATRVPMRGKTTRLAATPSAPSRVVAGTGVAVKSNVEGLGPVIEAAMVQAINDARAAGITDDKEIAKRMAAARERAKADFEAKAKVPAAKASGSK